MNHQSIKSRLGWSVQNNRRTGQRPRFNRNHAASRPNNRSTREMGNQRSAVLRSNNQETRRKRRTRRGAPKRSRNNQPRNPGNSPIINSQPPTANVQLVQPGNSNEILLETEFLTIPVFLFCKKVTAALDTGCSLTKIGKDIANMAVANGFEIKEKTLVLGEMRKKVKIVTILLGTRMANLRPIECLIDRSAPPSGVIIGLRALSILNAQVLVDQIPAVHHAVTRKTPSARQRIEVPAVEIPEEPFQEEDFVAAISAAERREMESWL